MGTPISELLPTPAGLAAAGFLLSLIFTPIARSLALRSGWVDRPDDERKRHAAPTPRNGGVAVLAAWFLAILMFHFAGAMDQTALGRIAGLIPAILTIFVTGLLDDLIELTPKQKLGGQAAAALLACASGLYFKSLAGFAIDPIPGVGLTVIWLMTCPNCFNLIDGADGLAAGIGAIAAVAVVAASLQASDPLPMLLAAPLAGALLGFLRHNFSPASIFLGDSGSLFSGFVLGCCLILWPTQGNTGLAALAPVFVFAVPFLDTGISVVRRYLAEQPICGGDHGHLHHRLKDSGLPAPAVALSLYGAGVAGAAAGLIQSSRSSAAGMLATALYCLAIVSAAACLYKPEWRILRELVRKPQLRSRARARVALGEYERVWQSAGSPDECWWTLRQVAREAGFSHCSLRIGDRHFEDRSTGQERPGWTLLVRLPESGYVALAGSPESAASLDAVVDALVRSLSSKALEFSPATAMRLGDKATTVPGRLPASSDRESESNQHLATP